MSEQPIKLTNIYMDHIASALADYYGHDNPVGERVLYAILALRDRALAVYEDAFPCSGDDKDNSLVDNKKLDALSEVLP